MIDAWCAFIIKIGARARTMRISGATFLSVNRFVRGNLYVNRFAHDKFVYEPICPKTQKKPKMLRNVLWFTVLSKFSFLIHKFKFVFRTNCFTEKWITDKLVRGQIGFRTNCHGEIVHGQIVTAKGLDPKISIWLLMLNLIQNL